MLKIIIRFIVYVTLFSPTQVFAQSDFNKSKIKIINSEDFINEFNLFSSPIEWEYDHNYLDFSRLYVQNVSLFEVKVDLDPKIEQPTNYDLSKWSFTLWGGLMTNNDLAESLTGSNLTLEDSQLLGVGVNRKIAETKRIKLEGEFQLLNHSGKQSHLEATVALVLRWIIFSRFNLAVVEGLSFATDIPRIEDERNTPETQLLNYLALEAEYSYSPEWSFSARLHHRSGVGGLFGGVYGGSNAYIFGIRRRF